MARAPESELPEQLRIGFVQSGGDYLPGASTVRIPHARSRRIEGTELPVALSEADAQRIADRWASESWAGRDGARFALPPSALRFEPGDVIGLDDGTRVREFRLDAVEDRGARPTRAKRIQAPVYERARAAERVRETPLPPPPAPVVAAFMDLPLLTGDEVAHQPTVAAFARPWPGGVTIYDSASDDGFAFKAQIERPATLGVTLTDLRPAEPSRWSRQTLDVRVGRALDEAARDEVLNGANAAALMTPSGQWEVLQFQSVDPIGANQYRLSGLLRGQAGTEPFMGDPTEAGARFVLLDGTQQQIGLPVTRLGLDRRYRYGPSSQSFDHRTYQTDVLSFAGAGLRPYAPAHVRAVDEGGDLAISWVRRSRIDGDAWISDDPPLGEESELYRLRIVKDGAVLREVEKAKPKHVYTAAQRTADGAAAPFEITVAQISASFGPGPERSLTIDV
jgi:hypothetical protein